MQSSADDCAEEKYFGTKNMSWLTILVGVLTMHTKPRACGRFPQKTCFYVGTIVWDKPCLTYF